MTLRKRSTPGYTLTELLSALAITLLVLTFALPGWQTHRQGVARIEAARLLEAARTCSSARRALERAGAAMDCLPSPTASYRFMAVPLPADSAAGIEWRGEPLGSQREDGCGTLVLADDGTRGVLGASVDSARCWRRP